MKKVITDFSVTNFDFGLNFTYLIFKRVTFSGFSVPADGWFRNFSNSISDMGCQKVKVVLFLRYSGYLTNTSSVCQVAGISKSSNNKQKSFFLKEKKIGVLLFETLKN